MMSKAFIELSFGDITLVKRLVTIARRWSDLHKTVVWLRGVDRRWVELLLEEVGSGTGFAASKLRILGEHEEAAALREASTAGVCIVSSAEMMRRLEGHQTCVYWPSTAFSFGSLEWPPAAAGEPARPRALLQE